MFRSGDAPRKAPLLLVALLAGALVPSIGCFSRGGKVTVLRLATTTSTRDSGLLDELLPVFERQHDCRVDVVAVGTGAALKLGAVGDADVLIVHARNAELAFMKAGHGTRHEEFMYNDFVLLGPTKDPARIRGLGPIDAMKKIAEGRHRFVSRGDDSGTHKRERILWKAAGVRPAWNEYLETGQGMGATLILADEKQGYLLTDRGTYLRLEAKVGLIPLAVESDRMRNPYAVIMVNPEKHSRINGALGNALVEFLISSQSQRLIGGFGPDGRQLFYPTRLAPQD